MNVLEVQKCAIPQIKDLLKKEPEAVSSIEKTNEGWMVICDVLEKKAIPDTFDILKVYEFILNNEGKVIKFKQLKKIRRGDID